MPVTMGIMEVLTVNKMSRLIIAYCLLLNPFVVNAPLIEKPVACFALVSCMKNTFPKKLHLYLKWHLILFARKNYQLGLYIHGILTA